MQLPRTTGKQHGMAMQYLEPAEVLSVLKAAKARGQREWAMVLVAYKHGARASEVCNLRVDDLDLKNGTIIIARLTQVSWFRILPVIGFPEVRPNLCDRAPIARAGEPISTFSREANAQSH
jgi:integrase